jgi:nicotinamidase-related amidase
MRDFKVFVPEDCVVSNSEEENRYALKQMQTVLKADTSPAAQLDLKALSS